MKLVWHVRHAEDVYWITGILDKALRVEGKDEDGTFGGVQVDVEVWVTRGQRSSEHDENVSPLSSSAGVIRLDADMDERYGSAAHSAVTSDVGGPVREMTEINETTGLLQCLENRTDDFTRGYLGFPDTSIRSSSCSASLCPDHSRSDRYRPLSAVSPAVQGIFSVHAGRADIASLVQQLADQTESDPAGSESRMVVVSCGPVQLMHDTRNGVARVNSWRRLRSGGSVVEYLEETVGH